MSMLTPIKPQRVYVQIVEQIIDLINRDEFPLGSQLPSERELARRLAVSRAPVREALSALQILGLVDTRPGQGTIVTSEVSPLLRRKASSLYEEESPFALLEARKGLEPYCARLAAANRSDEALQAIAGVLDALADDPADPQAFGDGDRRFHLAIAEAAQNPVLSTMMSVIYDLMGQKLWQTLMQESTWNITGRRRDAIAEHRNVYTAICERDESGAARLMLQHLESVERSLMESELVPLWPRNGTAGSGKSSA